MRKFLSLSLTSLAVLSSLTAAPMAEAAAPDRNGSTDANAPVIVTSFDWQAAWGSIHTNTYADGLNDPGIPSTLSGTVPCLAGTNACGTPGANSPVANALGAATGIVHGIKADIKNSVVNCASIQIPTWPKAHGTGAPAFSFSHDYVCAPNAAGTGPRGVTHTNLGDPYTLVYMPISDPRSNDTRNNASVPNNGGYRGCNQQIANNCVRDIYDCDPVGVNHTTGVVSGTDWGVGVPAWNTPILPAGSPLGQGYAYPYYHVFSQAEESQLGITTGAQVPSTYYRYTPATQHYLDIKAAISGDQTAVNHSGSVSSTNTIATHKWWDLQQANPAIAPNGPDLTYLDQVETNLQTDVSTLGNATTVGSATYEANTADAIYTAYLTNTIGSNSYTHGNLGASFGAGPTCLDSTGIILDNHGNPTTDCGAIAQALQNNDAPGVSAAENTLAIHLVTLDNSLHINGHHSGTQGLWNVKDLKDHFLSSLITTIGSTGPFSAAGPFGPDPHMQIGPYANGSCPAGTYTNGTDCQAVLAARIQLTTDVATQVAAQLAYDTAWTNYTTALTNSNQYSVDTGTLNSLAASLPTALSPTDPSQWPASYIDPRSGLAGYVTEAAVTTVDNKSDDLANIYTYTYSDTNYGEDHNSFIIVDPSHYYNLTSYQQTPSNAANIAVSQYPYNAIQQSNGVVGSVTTPPGNCPVLGLGEYDGICDPTRDTTVGGVTKATWAGCNLPIYGVGANTPTYTTSAGTVSAADYPVLWSGYVRDWKVIDVATYTHETSWRVGIGNQPIYATPTTIMPRLGNNPIIKLTRAMAYCNMEEMSQNPVELPSPKLDVPNAANPACVQYIQFQGNGFVDLYNPATYQDPASNAAAYVTKQDYYKADASGTLHQVLNGSGQPVSFFDTKVTYTDFGTPAKFAVVSTPRASLPLSTVGVGVVSPGTHMGVQGGRGAGIKLLHGTSVALQLEQQTVRWANNVPNGWDFSTGAVTSWTTADINCIEISNGPNGKDLFVPTDKTTELQHFVTAVAAGQVGGSTATSKVTLSACHDIVKSYAATGNGTSTWNGTLSCQGINPSCNQVQKIAAQRYCLRPTGSLGFYTECNYQVDPTITSAFVDPDAGALTHNGVPYLSGQTIGKMHITSVSPFYFEATCNSTNSCPGTATGGHVFCLAPETKITMADGSEKAITALKPGDTVKAFDGKHSRGLLRTAKVKATTKTEKQPLIEIDGLKITPFHKVVLANGRAVNAEDIKVGDTILKGDGMFETVKTVKKGLKPITVYNLVLEDADGYIANGKRVLDYPAPDSVFR